MALVEHMPQGGLLAWTPPTVQDSDLKDRLQVQNTYLATHVIRRLLKEDGINWQSRRNPAIFTHEAIAECGIREVCDTFFKAITRLRKVAAEEVEAMIQTLELGDSDLCDSYTRVGNNMKDGIHFGRIITFFYFTSVLCKRLHLDNRQRLIESVVEWLINFLNDTVSPWLESTHNGQWSRIQVHINTDRIGSVRPISSASTTGSRNGNSTSWATAAALGVGAFLVGLALR